MNVGDLLSVREMTPVPYDLNGHALPVAVNACVAQWLGRSSESSAEHRMRLVIELSQVSVDSGGGPFGAAVFGPGGELLSVGINRVVPWNSFEYHAECVALGIAQTNNRGGFQLPPQSELVTSSSPCCMCFGKFFWSGATQLTVAARREDVEQIVGFDEGPIPTDWQETLRRRGFIVWEEVLRDHAVRVLKNYSGPVYQSRTPA